MSTVYPGTHTSTHLEGSCWLKVHSLVFTKENHLIHWAPLASASTWSISNSVGPANIKALRPIFMVLLVAGPSQLWALIWRLLQNSLWLPQIGYLVVLVSLLQFYLSVCSSLSSLTSGCEKSIRPGTLYLFSLNALTPGLSAKYTINLRFGE